MGTPQATPHVPSDVSVMISYSRTDAVFAQQLRKDLQDAGFPTWLDTSDILGGRQWKREIDRAIDEAQVVLVVMSPDAMKSEWVRREYTYALRQRKVVIPLDYFPCDIPGALAGRQTISLRPNFVNPFVYYAQQFKELTTTIAGYASLDTAIPTPASKPLGGWALTGALILAGGVGTALAFLAGYADGALLPTFAQPYAPRVSLGAVAVVALSLMALFILRIRRQGAGIHLYLADRARFLTKVHTRYTNRLKPPFEGALRITLGLSEDAQAVAHPSLARQEGPGGTPQSLPAGTTIATAFENAEGQLLILGAPGAGKSWLLYQLAMALVERARTDGTIPVPVVFNLATWAQERKPLTDWMVDQLTETWQVPSAIARVWVDRRQVFPLLDGLDEVRRDARDACVESINRYQRDHGLEPLAVCCRKADYDALAVRLDLRMAVVAQPLTPEQIDSYLEAGGAPLAALRTWACADEQMRDLLSTPLLLNVVTLAYQGRGTDAIPKPSEDEKAWARAVFHDYVPAMLARRLDPSEHTRGKRGNRYSDAETTRYLAWLAVQMQEHGRTDMFYLEHFQPDWLPTDYMRENWRETVLRVYEQAYGLIAGLAVGLIAGLVVELVMGPLAGLVSGLLIGLLTGLVFWLGGGLSGNTARGNAISLFSAVIWESPGAGDLVGWLTFGLVIALSTGIVYGLAGWLIGALAVALAGWLIGGIGAVQVDSRDLTTPNEGLARSLRTGLIFGLAVGVGVAVIIGPVFGLVSSLLFWLLSTIGGLTVEVGGGLVAGLAGGLVFGVVGGLVFGLHAYLEHQFLQRTLARLLLIPRNIVGFLDFAADHVLLQRVGGGYRFVHALLLDYFADQWPDLSATPPKDDA